MPFATRLAGRFVKAAIVIGIDAEIAGLDILAVDTRIFQRIHQGLGLGVVLAHGIRQVRVIGVNADVNIGDIRGQVDRAVAADVQCAGLRRGRSAGAQYQCQRPE